nr:MAG TPA: hypothetical protein [Caudoviricetes sp.]
MHKSPHRWIVNLPVFPIIPRTCTNALVRINRSNRKLDIRAKSPCFFVGNRI